MNNDDFSRELMVEEKKSEDNIIQKIANMGNSGN